MDDRRRRSAASRGPLPRCETPIVPRNSIAGRALIAVVAIMTFLASLTTGAVMLVGSRGERMAVGCGARGHHPGACRRPGRDLDAEVAQGGVAIARAFAGIGEVRPYTQGGIGASCSSRGSAAGCRSTNCRCRA